MGLLDRLFAKDQKKPEVEVPPDQLPSRNEVCWCDSGLKYKKCHAEADQHYLAEKKARELSAKKTCSPVFG